MRRPQSTADRQNSVSEQETEGDKSSTVPDASREPGLLHAGDTAAAIQPKLTVNESDDKFEKEAERVADAVMRVPEPSETAEPQEKLLSDRIQRICPHCRRRARQGKPLNREQCEQELQRREDGEVDARISDSVEEAAEVTKEPGKSLSDPTKSFFESRMGENFSDVRIHTGAKADQAARSINAWAFTLGSDLVFRSGEHRPDTREGRRLLAHELTHVVQQGESSRRTSGHRERPGDDRRLIQRQAKTEEEESSDADEPCALTTFTTANFTNEEIVADRQFVDSLRSIDGYAASANVTVHVTHSFRTTGETPEGAIVEPANRSNHLVGHAIDMNLRADDGAFHNSHDLHPDRLPDASEGVRDFLRSIRDNGNLRWGGDFTNTDPVHIDDHLNASESEWQARYEATQQAHDESCM